MKYQFVEKYRINTIVDNSSENINWLFLPGGPGMGSEYLIEFVQELQLPGSLYIADFPGDGSNRNTDKIDYEEWKAGLLKLVYELQPCILVTHSFSGMFALTIPELEESISGLVILNSAPDKGWMQELGNTIKEYDLPNTSNENMRLYNDPTDQNVELLFDACIPYLFLPHEIEDGKNLLLNSSFNAKTRMWGDYTFHPNYEYTWVPSTLPTLIIGSKDDRLLPIKLFLENEDFDRSNIEIIELEDAGHFSWLSKFEEINDALSEFVLSI